MLQSEPVWHRCLSKTFELNMTRYTGHGRRRVTALIRQRDSSLQSKSLRENQKPRSKLQHIFNP